MKAVSGRLLDFIVLPISCLDNILVSNSMQQEIPWLKVTLYVPILDFWIQKKRPHTHYEIILFRYCLISTLSGSHWCYTRTYCLQQCMEKHDFFLDDHSGKNACLLTCWCYKAICFQRDFYLYHFIPSFSPYHPCMLYLPGILFSLMVNVRYI